MIFNKNMFSSNLMFQVVAQNLEDVVAKCYFGKRQLVWEILENRLKKKIQIPWGHISAMRATIEEKQPEVLEVEVYNIFIYKYIFLQMFENLIGLIRFFGLYFVVNLFWFCS